MWQGMSWITNRFQHWLIKQKSRLLLENSYISVPAGHFSRACLFPQRGILRLPLQVCKPVCQHSGPSWVGDLTIHHAAFLSCSQTPDLATISGSVQSARVLSALDGTPGGGSTPTFGCDAQGQLHRLRAGVVFANPILPFSALPQSLPLDKSGSSILRGIWGYLAQMSWFSARILLSLFQVRYHLHVFCLLKTYSLLCCCLISCSPCERFINISLIFLHCN